MTDVPTVDLLPAWPNPDSVEFETKIGPFTAALPVFAEQFNASIAAYNLTVQFPDGVVYQAQASPGDTTPGRLTKVGGFGLGGAALLLGASDDLDDIDFTGFHYNTSAGNVTGNNYPDAVAGGLFTLKYGTGRGVQIYGAYTGAGLYWRADGGGWKPWQRIYTNANVVGPVSQSGGVPTGAIVERGHNSNGEYVRFADGTQICWSWLVSGFDPNIAVGSVYVSPFQTWTFPAAFSVGPSVSGNIVDATSWAMFGTPSVSSVSLRVAKATSGTGVSAAFIAIGRWY